VAENKVALVTGAGAGMVVAFFASEEAGYITAQLIGVNGGATI